MIYYGDKSRTHEEVCAFFSEVHGEIPPIYGSRVVARYQETGVVKGLLRCGRRA